MLTFALCWAVAFLLVHEYVKEGYMFRVSDLLRFPTHESLIMLAIIAYAFLLLLCLRRASMRRAAYMR